MISSITIIGKLGADAIVRPSENPFIAFSVASNSKDKEGNEQVTWVNVTCSFKHFEKTLPYLKKGVLIALEGKPYSSVIPSTNEPRLSVYANILRLFSSPVNANNE